MTAACAALVFTWEEEDVILAAGLSPVWQQLLRFDALTLGEVNRAREVHWCASGKVLNAARGLHHLGGPVRALTLVGGATGAEIRQDFGRLGIAARWVESTTPTRICTTVLDTAGRTITELVPDAPALGGDELARFRAAYAEEAAAADVVILIGSLPAGVPSGIYQDLLAHTPGKAILDARGAELLAALREKPFLVKPNRDELGRTLGRELRGDAELFDAMRALNRLGARWVVVSDQGNPVYASSQGQLYQVRPPLGEVVNPIGCGDCMAGGIAWALSRGQEPLEAVAFGVAVAADKLGQLLPGVVDPGRVAALARSVEVTRLDTASGVGFTM
jgi:1-phosphofructokinase family hexose kinase